MNAIPMTGELLSSCLGVSFLGGCKEYFHDEYSFYNLGAAITGFGILLAGYQIVGDSFRFRHQFRRRYLLLSLGLVFLNLIFVFIGTLIPFIPGEPLVLLGYRPFWELLGASLFSFGMLMMAYVSMKPIGNIEIGDVQNLNNLIANYLSKGKSGALVVSEEFAHFFPSVLTFRRSGDTTSWNFLFLCKDGLLLKCLSENPGALRIIFDAYTKQSKFLNNFDDAGFLKDLFGACLKNSDSVLSRELAEGKGFNKGLEDNFLTPMICKDIFILQNFGLFNGNEKITSSFSNETYSFNFSTFLSVFFRNYQNFDVSFYERIMCDLIKSCFEESVKISSAKNYDLSVFSWLESLYFFLSRSTQLGRKFREYQSGADEDQFEVEGELEIEHVAKGNLAILLGEIITEFLFGFSVPSSKTTSLNVYRYFSPTAHRYGGNTLELIESEIRYCFLASMDSFPISNQSGVISAFFRIYEYSFFREYEINGRFVTPFFNSAFVFFSEMASKFPVEWGRIVDISLSNIAYNSDTNVISYSPLTGNNVNIVLGP